jgi:threonine dehydrogenase-like Zn-dependent dehydrogenase
MRAFACLEIGKVGWVERDRPTPGPMDAVVRPLALAPCTSDVHTAFEGAAGDRHDQVLGHEGVGEVVEVGECVRDFAPGDRVIISAITPDWNSIAAQEGYPMHSNRPLGGLKYTGQKDGMFAEYIHVNDADGNLARLPEDMDPAVGVMLSDMATTGFHGVELAGVEFGDNVCVVGIGPVGLMAVRGSVLRGAARVMAVGSRPKCVDVARAYGATDIINYRDGDILTQAMDLTGGRGVDRVIVAGGTLDTFDTAVKMVKAGGTIGNVNYLGGGDAIAIPRIGWGMGMAHKTIKGGLCPGGRSRMERLVRLVQAGRLDPSLLITHRFVGLDQIPALMDLMVTKPRDLIKPVLTVD